MKNFKEFPCLKNSENSYLYCVEFYKDLYKTFTWWFLRTYIKLVVSKGLYKIFTWWFS